MHDLIQSSEHDFTVLESSDTCQEVKALQLQLMVMSGSCEFGKIPKLSQILFSSQNASLFMVSFDVNPFLKYVWCCRYNILKFQDSTFDQIQDSISVDPSPYKDLVPNSSLEFVSLTKTWN